MANLAHTGYIEGEWESNGLPTGQACANGSHKRDGDDVKKKNVKNLIGLNVVKRHRRAHSELKKAYRRRRICLIQTGHSVVFFDY